jgi:hypothetical protein
VHAHASAAAESWVVGVVLGFLLCELDLEVGDFVLELLEDVSKGEVRRPCWTESGVFAQIASRDGDGERDVDVLAVGFGADGAFVCLVACKREV